MSDEPEAVIIPVAYFVFIHRDVNVRPRGRLIWLGLGLGLVTDTEYVTMYENHAFIFFTYLCASLRGVT